MRQLLTWLTAPAQVRRLCEWFFRSSGYRDPAHPANLSSARSILIVRPDHLGDVILTSAFLREFRRNWPQAEITLLVDPAAKPLVEQCPYVDRIETYARFQPCFLGQVRRLVREVLWARRHLWPHHFELAVVPRWDTQLFREAFLAYLSGAKWRVGFSEAGNTLPHREGSFEPLYTHLAPSDGCRHEAQRSLDLLAWIGGNIAEKRSGIWIDDADRDTAARMLPDTGTDAAVHVAMMPGSSSPGRRWAIERFAEIADWMTSELGWKVVLIGAASEAELGGIIENCCPQGVVNLIGRTNLRQAIAAIGRCNLYVGNDTGPMHMASALGVPVVEISCHPASGSPLHERSPLRFGPWDVPAWVAQPGTGLDDCREFCGPGERGEAHCILAVSLEQVKGLILEAARECRLLPQLDQPYKPTLTPGSAPADHFA